MAGSIPGISVGAPTGTGMSRGSSAAYAGFALELDLAGFNAQLEQFLKVTDAAITDVLTAQALDLQRRIQQKTPVLTGRLRNSIHTVFPGRNDPFFYSDNQGRGFGGSLNIKASPAEAIVGTNVPYAIQIEAGRSRKAPNGMFAVSVREKTGELEAEIGRRIGEAWDQASGFSGAGIP